MEDSLLHIENLEIEIAAHGDVIRAVDGVSFSISRGETFALLGESGCGKSMTALGIMKLLPPSARYSSKSKIYLESQNLLGFSEVAMRAIRGERIAMIFQEPMTSLNPVLTIGEQIAEVLKQHKGLKGRAAKQKVCDLLDAVGIPEPERRAQEFPHQLSGGMKQRVMIASALAGEPDLLIADEPTTALDVTIQAQVLDLLKDLQSKTGMAILLITHDLGVVKQMADQVAVMYAGHIVETAASVTFFRDPKHPYSRRLFASIPSIEKRNQPLSLIEGSVPPLNQTFHHCRFADRCVQAWELCHEKAPKWIETSEKEGVRCHLHDKDVLCKQSDASDAIIAPTEKIIEKASSELVLEVNDLKVHFPIQKGLLKRTVGYVKAVDGVTLQLHQGQTLALVGESGSGKTTTGRGILQLLDATSGSVKYNHQELMTLSTKKMHALRKDLQIIFQDPYSSLNPRMMIGDIIAEGLLAQKLFKSRLACDERIEELLAQVGLQKETKSRYPHEFSGGQRQRIAIARALALNPKVIVCDEPTSALDVSVQAQILNLLKQLQDELGLSYLFITHNISVVGYLAHEVAVMYQGKIVEQGPVDDILLRPQHPYTQRLLAAVPTV